MSNVSVVVNYEEHNIFPTGEATGYVQFTRSGNYVYITADGKPVGMVPTAEFSRVQKLFAQEGR